MRYSEAPLSQAEAPKHQKDSVCRGVGSRSADLGLRAITADGDEAGDIDMLG